MLRNILGLLHLWLGFSSGIIVFIIAVTGALYTFRSEIDEITQPYRKAEIVGKKMLPPSVIRKIADQKLPKKHIHAVLYKGAKQAAQAIYYSDQENYYFVVYINPYTGMVQKVKDMQKGFFPFILDGHFYLWLPNKVGQIVVATATLIFIVLMLSGMYLWVKRKKGSGGQRFSIKWNARWRRKNYDLHNVLGIYVMILGLCFAITGLVWGFEWFSKFYYAAISGGKKMNIYQEPLSDSTATSINLKSPSVDLVWQKILSEHATAETIEIHFPENKTSAIAANTNEDASTYWKTDYQYFDQNTLQEIQVKHAWGRLHASSGADLIMKMNYDIHTGAVLGLPGKTLACLASLIIASLPITGFLVWWGRKFKVKKKKIKKSNPILLL